MRTLTSKKFILRGFNDKGPYVGWVFTEHSDKYPGDDAILIVNEAKFVNDGVVYHLSKNGTWSYGNKSYMPVEARQPAYAYDDCM